MLKLYYFSMDTGLKNKVVLITGASGGIGRVSAKMFAEEGARLILTGRRMDALSALKSELDTESIVLIADLTNESEVRSLFDQGFEHFGQLDVVVANAGMWVSDDVPVSDMSLDQWQHTVNTNQTSVFFCAREFFSILKKTEPDDASLIIVGSSAAIFGEATHSDYSAAKAAITYGLTKSLKNEIVNIVPHGRVNAVCPGWTQTPMAEAGLQDQAAYKRAMQTRAIPEISQPEDIAPMIVFLASHRLSGQITGEVITIAAGMEGRMLHQLEDIKT